METKESSNLSAHVPRYNITLAVALVIPLGCCMDNSSLPSHQGGLLTHNIKKVRSEAQRKAALKQWQAEIAVTEGRSLADEAVAV